MMTATRSIGEVGSATLPASAWGDVAGSGRPGYRPRALLLSEPELRIPCMHGTEPRGHGWPEPGPRGRLFSRSPARNGHSTGTGPGGRDAIQGVTYQYASQAG